MELHTPLKFIKVYSKMASSMYSYEFERCELSEILLHCISDKDVNIEVLENKVQSFPRSDADKKTTLEQAFRDVLCKLHESKSSSTKFTALLERAIEAAKKDLCSFNLSVNILNDVFDLSTIDQCEQVFGFVETNVNIWKEDPTVFASVKNSLLRVCNDLLRRLSRSRNTVFCGRILLLLAKFFPLSERSGLNIISEFNLDNVTLFSDQDDDAMVVDMEKEKAVEAADPKGIHVDYNLYRKFWSLQDYFRSPSQCYNKLQWRTFIAHSADVLSAFGSFKLDDAKYVPKKFAEDITDNDNPDKTMYFAKYLTNQKLLDLQLADSNFRRYVLVQFMILFQYLNTTVKFKVDTQTLNEDQSKWIKETTDWIMKLLDETPPDGPTFSKTIQHLLAREENWSNWKNDGCHEFHSNVTEDPVKLQGRKRKLGEEFRNAVSRKKVLMGTIELTRLWNLCPNNMEACKVARRDFLPSLETFFEEAVVQADPANMIEDQYKHIYNGNWGWRALRLLARRSPHFFTPSNQPISKLPLYLEAMIKKLAKDFPQHSAIEEIKTELADTTEPGDDMDDDLLKQSEDMSTPNEQILREDVKDNLVTLDQIKQLSALIGSAWKQLAVILHCAEEEISYYESENTDTTQQACTMLTVWQERDPDETTVQVLWQALKKANMSGIAEEILGPEPVDSA